MVEDRQPIPHLTVGEFEASASSEFGFLKTEYGFKGTVRRSNAGKGFGWVTYDTSNLRVDIGYDEFRRELDVYLVRASEDGSFPEYLEKPDHWISLDILTLYRAQGQESPPRPEDPEQLLEYYADQTRKYAPDLLGGDLTVFPEVRRFIEERVKAAGSPIV